MASAHAKISWLKSGIRIVGYIFLGGISHHPAAQVAAVFLIAAEILGICEEIDY